MNYQGFYLSKERKDLFFKTVGLLLQPGYQGDGKFNKYMKGINTLTNEYKMYILKMRKNMRAVNRAIPPVITNADPYCIMLIIQRLNLIRSYLFDNELYEILPNFWEVNKQLAESILKVRKDIDVSALLSEKQFDEAIEKLHWEIAHYIVDNNLTI